MTRNRPRTRGFTLIEVVIVLAILALLAGLLVPLGYQLLTAERARLVEGELQAIHTAIVGDPAKGSFGYVGDVGKFPARLLDLLVAPRDSTDQPVAGWKGPYLLNPRVENGVHVDPFARPYEYFLRPVAVGVGNQLAILSRGPDGASSNDAANPNIAASYTGPSPVDPAYAADPRNADNLSFPSLSGPDALTVIVSGDLALNILNFDANPKVNAFVPACPQLFTVTATSVARGTVEAAVPWVPGLQFDLVQGPYRVAVSARAQPTAPWSETLTVLPAATVTRTLNLTGLDSSATPPFGLTVKNGLTTTDLEVFEFDARLAGRLSGETSGRTALRPGETRVYTPHGCAQIYVREKGTSAVVDQFVMPYGASTRQVGQQAATLTVVNRAEARLRVLRNQIVIGTVPRGDVHDDEGTIHGHVKTRTFADLSAGDLIEIRTDRQLELLVSLALTVGENVVTVR